MEHRVFIAVGHGGDDPGAVANGFREKDLNLEIAKSCRDELARHGVTVKMDRETDVELSMSETVNLCNAFNPALALDIHNNAGGGDGAEVFYTIGGGTGKTMAVNILDEIVKIGQNSRGAKTRKNSSGGDYYGFIRMTNPPAVIVECAFVDNITDMQIIDTTAERVKMGQAIAKGVLKTLGVSYKADIEKPVSVPTQEFSEIYRVQVGAFRNKNYAEALMNELKEKGYKAFVVKGESK